MHQLPYKRWGKLIGDNTLQMKIGKKLIEIKAFKADILKFRSNHLNSQSNLEKSNKISRKRTHQYKLKSKRVKQKPRNSNISNKV